MNRRNVLTLLAATPLAACQSVPHDLIDERTGYVDKAVLEFSDAYKYVAGAGFVISGATNSWCNHVDFVLPDGRLLGAVPEGVSIRSPDHPPWVRTERYEFDCVGKDVYSFALLQVGKFYDVPANAGYFLGGLHLPHAMAWNCSPLVAVAARKGGTNLCPTRSPTQTAPGDLIRSPLLRRI